MKDDLSHAIDAVSLAQIIKDFTPSPDTARLGERGGAIRDPRPGHEEQSPSFSVFPHDGRQLYKRHGGDGATGNAYQYLTNEVGMSPADAALEIKRRAGLTTTTPRRDRVPVIKYAPIGEDANSELEISRSLLAERWPVQTLAARGFTLSSVQTCGLGLTANGDTVIPITDPSGHVVSIKRRAAAQDAIPRYIYLEGGTGSPAWCSPGYGKAQAVLIVEGELNGMIAHLALEEAGITMDVQGLAGASGKPHAGVLEGRDVLIYTDGDEPGLKARDEWARLAHDAGAASVRVFEVFPDGLDACEIAGADGLEAFGAVLQERIRDAVTVEAELGEVWPEPELFTDALEPVPHLNKALLPEPLRTYCMDAAQDLSVPLEFVAVPVLAAFASFIARRVGLRLKRFSEWTVYGNLYSAIIGPPSVAKTPSLEVAARPVRALEAKARKQYLAQIADDQAENIILETKLSALKSKSSKEHKGLDDEERKTRLKEVLADIAAIGTTEPRYIVNDVTDAKLVPILNENPHGVTFMRDEITAFLEQLERGEHFSRALYLELWSGDAHHTVDRKGDGTSASTVRVDGGCLGIVGGIQPSKLQKFLAESYAQGSSDGFFARFLAVWPDHFGTFQFSDRYPNDEARRGVNRLFEWIESADFTQHGALEYVDRFAEVDGESAQKPPYYTLDDTAYEVFKEFYTETMQRMSRDGFGSAEDEFTGKAGKQLGSIALGLHLARVHSGEAKPGPVDEQTLLMAIGWLEFFAAHWKKIMSLAKQATPAAMLADRIRQGHVKDGLTVRELGRKNWAGLRTTAQVSEALESLEDAGWLRLENISKGTRESLAVRVNPKIKVSKGSDADE